LALQRLEIRFADIVATAEKILLLVDGQNINDVQLFGDRLDVLTGNPQQATRIIQNAIDHLSDINPSEATLDKRLCHPFATTGFRSPFYPLTKV
jgi:ABC-2 type transport system ATP-binding protein